MNYKITNKQIFLTLQFLNGKKDKTLPIIFDCNIRIEYVDSGLYKITTKIPFIQVKTIENKEINIDGFSIVNDEVNYWDTSTYTWINIGKLEISTCKDSEQIADKVIEFIRSIRVTKE